MLTYCWFPSCKRALTDDVIGKRVFHIFIYLVCSEIDLEAIKFSNCTLGGSISYLFYDIFKRLPVFH